MNENRDVAKSAKQETEKDQKMREAEEEREVVEESVKVMEEAFIKGSLKMVLYFSSVNECSEET